MHTSNWKKESLEMLKRIKTILSKLWEIHHEN